MLYTYEAFSTDDCYKINLRNYKLLYMFKYDDSPLFGINLTVQIYNSVGVHVGWINNFGQR